jgi:mannose-6-phosphate isomerase-like protein (cupin superfamily)
MGTAMIGFVGNIAEMTEVNSGFRHVVYSGAKLQLGLMALQPGEDLGGEIHPETDQFYRVEAGKGLMVIDGVTHRVSVGHCALVPGGTHHNLICTGHEPLKVFTICGPAQHLDQVLQQTKADAEAEGQGYDGQTTEREAEVLRV